MHFPTDLLAILGDNRNPMVFAASLRRPPPGAPTSFLLALIVASVFLSAPALAEDKTAARDHWERGTKFYDLGKYDDAIREFEAAYEAKSDPAFLYNLAQSHRLAGHASDSLRFYRTYLRYVPKPANRTDIEGRIKELEKIVAERPATEPAVTSPSVPNNPGIPGGGSAEHPTGMAPTQYPPSSGSAGANWPQQGGPGAVPLVPIGGANPQPQAIAPGPAVDFSTLPPPSGPAAEQKSGRRTAGIAIGASGGGLIVLGGVFGLVAQSKSKAVETAATNGERFNPSVEKSGQTFEKLQWIGVGIGAAALLTGVILYATAPTQYETAQPARVAITPLALPCSRSGGAMLRVTF